MRHEFFTYRNGVVADTLKRAGDPHRMIFGLTVPQLADLARAHGAPDPETARRLWEDSDCRESRLLACYFFDPAATSAADAVALAADCLTQEEADMLAFRLLKRMPDPAALLADLESAPRCARAAAALRRHLQG